MKTIIILTCLPGYSGRLIYASKTAVRFIPAYTGNYEIDKAMSRLDTVHPRLHGELTQTWD